MTPDEQRPAWLRGVVAHRGAPRVHLENTVQGILEAARLGAAAVEVDVRTTRDGVPVLHHDPGLPRRAGGARIHALGLAELRDRAPHVPTLAQALAVATPGVPLVLDIGTVATAEACLAALAAAGRRAWFCGAAGALAWLRARDPGMPLLLSWSGRRPPPEPLVAQVAPTMYNPGHRRLPPAAVRYWHERGVGVCTWTVDRSWRRRRLLRWGVDAIISNDVAGAVRDVRLARRPPA